MDKETMDRLVNEAMEMLSDDDIYQMAFEHIDINAFAELQEQGESLDLKTVEKIFALAGFISGMRFTMENLTEIPDEPTT